MATTTVEAGTNIEETDPRFPSSDDGKISCTVEFNPGDDLAEAVEMYGEDIVYERWLRQVRRDLGNAIRSSLNSGKTPQAVEEELSDWRPDVTRRSSGSSKTLEQQFAELSEEEKQAKLEQLMAIAQQ